MAKKFRARVNASFASESSCAFRWARPVNAIDGRAGLVVAGGEKLFVLRRGAQRLMFREPPDSGEILHVAAETCAPWRFAVATVQCIAVFTRVNGTERTLRIKSARYAAWPTHLAWARYGHASALYARWSDGSVVRTMPDMSGVEVVDLDGVDAIASDGTGRLALAISGDGFRRLYRTQDGLRLHYDQFPLSGDAGAAVRLAAAGDAAALAVGGYGVFVTRGRGAPLVLCRPLREAARIEFEGSSSDACLFGAVNATTHAEILRVDSEGRSTPVAVLEPDGAAVPEIVSLSWDSARQRLWVASPEVGIIACAAPGGSEDASTN